MPKKEIVILENVFKKFGSNQILSDINLKIFSGEVVGIVGPNGGGKSTLLKIIAGLLRPSEGEAKVCGHHAYKIAVESQGLVGLVLARPGLYPLLTGWENLNYFGGLFGLDASEILEKSKDLLSRFNLEKEMDKKTQTWSTGTQQKLSLVRALLLSPKLLLFDEPTANLDPLSARLLFDELRLRADEGLACVLVTHQLSAAESICERILFVDGAIKEEVKNEKKEMPKSKLMDLWEVQSGGSK